MGSPEGLPDVLANPKNLVPVPNHEFTSADNGRIYLDSTENSYEDQSLFEDVLAQIIEFPNEVINWETLESDELHDFSIDDLLKVLNQLKSGIFELEKTLKKTAQQDLISVRLKKSTIGRQSAVVLQWLAEQQVAMRFGLWHNGDFKVLQMAGFFMEQCISLASYLTHFPLAGGETLLHKLLFSPVTQFIHKYIDFDSLFNQEPQMWAETKTIEKFLASELFFKNGLVQGKPRVIHGLLQDREMKMQAYQEEIEKTQAALHQPKLHLYRKTKATAERHQKTDQVTEA